MQIAIDIISFPLSKPFAITGHVFTETNTLRVTLKQGGATGVGEAVGVYYLGETAQSMAAEIEAIGGQIGDALSGEQIQSLLPPGGARNALDCAFWDLRAKRAGKSVWELLTIVPKELTTVFTLGMEAPEVMARWAAEASRFPHLKIKLDANQPMEKLEAVRAARPDAELIIDVNQGWNLESLRDYLPHCARLGIRMIEQPLPRDEDQGLEDFNSPVPLGADESCLHSGEFKVAASRYDVLNIKLDKCGGLSEGLALVRAAQEARMGLMVGNMTGTSLSMAPSYVIGQYCGFVDIDGPLLLANDVPHGLNYRDGGLVEPPSRALWG
ncbi:MAG: L-alanine-DL-glutamate epimerase-like enolase superfamily enzyme [Halieaceae bacterium]|jgi:L-alanine-DL-glutamate epimerase-like enolase superfamily enzyme